MTYLSTRQIYVELGGESSDLFPVHGSVPQASCLGPLFYNVYTNDFVNYIQDPETILLADDTTFTLIGPNLPELIDRKNNGHFRVVQI